MKKNRKLIVGIGIVVLIIAIIVVFNILHLDKMKCNNEIKEETYQIKNNYTLYYKKDIVKKVLIERIVESKNNTVLSFFEKNYKDEFKKYNKDFGGYTIKSSEIKNHKLNFIVEVNFKKVDMNKLKEKNPYLKDDIKNKNLTLDGSYKLFQLNEKTCKK